MNSRFELFTPTNKEALKELEIHNPLVQSLLLRRGITKMDSADIFLNPDYERDIHDPFLMKDIDKAVERIFKAIKNNERILIYADYDMDGIPGAVVFSDFFKKIEYKNVEVYFPHRNKEGFGLNTNALESFKDNADLLITIDCGINNVEEVQKANELGIDVIVTDHHLPADVLPAAVAILNPKQEGCEYPFKLLCGAGVIFKLVQALIRKGNEEKLFDVPSGWEKWLLDMVGMATLSDMVPLVGENRVLVHYGLIVLRKSPRTGLMKLLRKARVKQGTLSEDDVAFTIAPRINAASRMDVPMDAFRLLSTEDEIEADMLGDHLNHINDERKGVVGSVVRELKKRIEKRPSLGPVIVLGDLNWKPSILGLACMSLVEEHNRPVFLWGKEQSSIIKGSCRSDGSVNVVELMGSVLDDTFLEFGGHVFSGGFSVREEYIHTLEERLIEAHEAVESHHVETEICVDGVLSLEDILWDTHKDIQRLAPFGEGNPKPLFLFKNIKVNKVVHFGKKQNHLKLEFQENGGRNISAIAFFKTPEHFEAPLEEGGKINLIAHMEKSDFGRSPELRLRIVDIV